MNVSPPLPRGNAGDGEICPLDFRDSAWKSHKWSSSSSSLPDLQNEEIGPSFTHRGSIFLQLQQVSLFVCLFIFSFSHYSSSFCSAASVNLDSVLGSLFFFFYIFPVKLGVEWNRNEPLSFPLFIRGLDYWLISDLHTFAYRSDLGLINTRPCLLHCSIRIYNISNSVVNGPGRVVLTHP